MVAFKRFGGLEVLQIADSVARSKGISKECVLNALEEGIKVAARQKYGKEQSIKVTINRSNGDIGIYKGFIVVESPSQLDPESGSYLLSCDERLNGKDVEIGSVIYERIPPPEIARLAAQSAKNVISSKIREEERKVEHNEFCNRIGDILGGIVDRIERGNIIIRIGSSEAIIRRGALLRTDEYKQGDRVRACLDSLDSQTNGPQLILSRTSNQFLSKLISLEVPEVMDGIIDVVSVARDPGSRAKVAVYSRDKSINPVGSCIGMKGNRIKSVMNELKGEKIDLVEWTADLGQMIINAFAPIPILKVLIDEEKRCAEVIVAQDCQSATIGRGGAEC
ncbi:Transcription termination/antitermination protein NusA N-terminal domain protein [Candidatus Cyrtobacter comes]|uniref:Transcription termination/antitermination protein NusA N-terminal domain protein n=1 Tax=Candidatus Cyrtobacter comes TaxID=675776 RepID=A0ABU5L742_9RICK|nr:transcription termination factor NusA [Candidatus Cyrtobacter comes]MDZ5761943.1 Transcription termination/antitermination protein NusA N-terminal domain protein [Candidatus Cyrtobacter comes]